MYPALRVVLEVVVRHSVTRTTQNEALLWKITDLRIERAPCWCRNILSLAHTGIWHSSMQEMSSCSRSRTFCSADAGRFRKNLKIKTTGKTSGVSPHGEGRSRTFFANLVNLAIVSSILYWLSFILYCLLYFFYCKFTHPLIMSTWSWIKEKEYVIFFKHFCKVIVV